MGLLTDNMRVELEQKVEMARSRALEKISNEIDLFVLSLKRRQDEAPAGSTSNTFNIYSPVGSIQTGANSVANVTQSIDLSTKQQLTEALTEVERGLQDLDTLPTHPKQEIAEIIADAKAELAKTQPNTSKLCSLLGTTATAIQTVASMKPAHELLKTGLQYLGIGLP